VSDAGDRVGDGGNDFPASALETKMLHGLDKELVLGAQQRV